MRRAQGAVSVTGFETAGQGETLSQGVPTAAASRRRAGRARSSADPRPLRCTLELKNPDFETAVRIVDAINAYGRGQFRAHAAFELRLPASRVPPTEVGFARFMADVGELQVEPDTVARVVLDARTGTIVIGQDVQISTVAVTYGTLSVRSLNSLRFPQPRQKSRTARRW